MHRLFHDHSSSRASVALAVSTPTAKTVSAAKKALTSKKASTSNIVAISAVTFPSYEPGQVSIFPQALIGRGEFADVYKGVVLATQQLVAIKVIHIKPNDYEHSLDACRKEAAIMRQLTEAGAHGTMPCLGAFVEPIRQNNYIIVMPYLPNKTLTDWLKNEKVMCFERQVSMISKITQGVKFTHMNKVFHCDLKSDNIMIDENFHPVIVDNGLSLRMNVDPLNVSHGTPYYMAPEILARLYRILEDEDDDNSAQKKYEDYSSAADIYSVVHIFWQIFARIEMPYIARFTDAKSFTDYIIKQEGREKMPAQDKCPPFFAKLITFGWAQKASDRPTAKQLDASLIDYCNQAKIKI